MNINITIPDIPDHFKWSSVERDTTPSTGDMYYSYPKGKWLEVHCNTIIKVAPFVARQAVSTISNHKVERGKLNIRSFGKYNGYTLDETKLPKGWTVEYRGIGWETTIPCSYVVGHRDRQNHHIRVGDYKYTSKSAGLCDCVYWELIPPQLSMEGLRDGWSVEYQGIAYNSKGRYGYFLASSVNDDTPSIYEASMDLPTTTNGVDNVNYWELIPPYNFTTISMIKGFGDCKTVWIVKPDDYVYSCKAEVVRGMLRLGATSVQMHKNLNYRWSNCPFTAWEDGKAFVV